MYCNVYNTNSHMYVYDINSLIAHISYSYIKYTRTRTHAYTLANTYIHIAYIHLQGCMH